MDSQTVSQWGQGYWGNVTWPRGGGTDGSWCVKRRVIAMLTWFLGLSYGIYYQ